MTHGREFTAEAERHEELCPRLPLLEPAAQERRVGVGASERIATVGVVVGIVLIEQLLAHAEEPPAANHIEPGHDQVLGGGELELPLFDDPFLLTEFGRPRQGLDERLLPVERDPGRSRLV